MKKQTAVEYLEKICKDRGYYLMEEYFEQAKAMEKEQMMDAFMDGKWDWSEHIKDGKESKDPSEYYNETYGK